MRKLIVLVGFCSIGIGLYFGFIHQPPESGRANRTPVIPAIEFVFTRDENAADYYAKACDSLSRRSEGDKMPESLTRQERKWFMLGTSCRRSSWYPEHYPHVVDPSDPMPQIQHQRNLAKLMAQEGRSAEENGDVEKAIDIWKRIAVFGWHTEREEECTPQFLVGIALEAMAYNEFIRYYRERGDSEQARRYEGFKQRLREPVDELLELTRLESLGDYRRVKAMAVSRKSAMWRKEGCCCLAYYCITRDASCRQDALATLNRISREDPDPSVRQTARNLIPYVLGQKSWPELTPRTTED